MSLSRTKEEKRDTVKIIRMKQQHWAMERLLQAKAIMEGKKLFSPRRSGGKERPVEFPLDEPVKATLHHSEFFISDSAFVDELQAIGVRWLSLIWDKPVSKTINDSTGVITTEQPDYLQFFDARESVIEPEDKLSGMREFLNDNRTNPALVAVIEAHPKLFGKHFIIEDADFSHVSFQGIQGKEPEDMLQSHSPIFFNGEPMRNAALPHEETRA